MQINLCVSAELQTYYDLALVAALCMQVQYYLALVAALCMQVQYYQCSQMLVSGVPYFNLTMIVAYLFRLTSIASMNAC